jgi:hypothetical protein
MKIEYNFLVGLLHFQYPVTVFKADIIASPQAARLSPAVFTTMHHYLGCTTQ